MAKQTISQRTARKTALLIAAKGDIEQAARAFDEVRAALTQWADELTTDAENIRLSAVGVQAEAIRGAVSALTLRGASERLAIVSLLLADEGAAS